MTIQEENQKNDIRFLFSWYSRKDKFYACKRSTSTEYIVYQSQGSIEVDLFQKDEARRSHHDHIMGRSVILHKAVAIERLNTYNTIPLTHVRRR